MENWLYNEYIEKNKIQDKIYIGQSPFFISIKEYNARVKEHNIRVNMPKLNEYKLEKESFLKWRGYNTPSLKDLSITPLFGTGFHGEIETNTDSLPSSVFNQWEVASHYLIFEYNLLKKALYYMNNINLNLSEEYMEAYFYWMNRQLGFIDFQKEVESKSFIIDFTIGRDNLYREVCEDYLYVLLNILLANSIINNLDLKLSIKNENLFFDILKSIIELHYTEFKKEYICLNELRIYSSNYCLSVNQLNSIHKEMKKKKEKTEL